MLEREQRLLRGAAFSSAEYYTETRHATCFSLLGLWSLRVAISPSVSSPARLSTNVAFDTNPSARQWYDPVHASRGGHRRPQALLLHASLAAH